MDVCSHLLQWNGPRTWSEAHHTTAIIKIWDWKMLWNSILLSTLNLCDKVEITVRKEVRFYSIFHKKELVIQSGKVLNSKYQVLIILSNRSNWAVISTTKTRSPTIYSFLVEWLDHVTVIGWLFLQMLFFHFRMMIIKVMLEKKNSSGSLQFDFTYESDWIYCDFLIKHIYIYTFIWSLF